MMCICRALRSLHPLHKPGFKIKLSIIKGYMVTLKNIQFFIYLKGTTSYIRAGPSSRKCWTENCSPGLHLSFLFPTRCSSFYSLALFLCSSSNMRFYLFLSPNIALFASERFYQNFACSGTNGPTFIFRCCVSIHAVS